MSITGPVIQRISASDFSEAQRSAGRIDWPSLEQHLGRSVVGLDVCLSAHGRSSMEIDMLDLGDVSVSWHASTAISMARERHHLANSEQDVTLTMPMTGAFTARQGGICRVVARHHAVVLDAARASHIELAGCVEFIGIRLPLTLLRDHGASRADCDARLMPTGTVPFTLLSSYIFGLRTLPAPLSVEQAALAGRHVSELVAQCLDRRAATCTALVRYPNVNIVREAALALMQRHYDDATLTVADVACWMQLSEGQIETSFADAGTSFDHELATIRIGHIGRSLHDPLLGGSTLEDIALMHGYDRSADMQMSFDRFFGTDPQSYRIVRRC